MATRINGKSVKNRIRNMVVGRARMCLICGEEYFAEPNDYGAICPTCRTEYGIKQKRKNEWPCDKWKICKKCAHRTRFNGAGDKSHYICSCLNHTGEIRDLTTDGKCCKTFEPKGLKRYEDT